LKYTSNNTNNKLHAKRFFSNQELPLEQSAGFALGIRL